ncbi:MAG: ABC transporter permease [Candidatus Hatepunaea meridiana]|nr:ABC transporter permease [Candidatus Hatepunaea meridiana]
MNLSDVKLSWRTHKKSPLFAVINILGLAVAMAAVILIAIYVRYELSYDAHWKNADRIYRVNGVWTTETGEEITSPTSVGALKTAFDRDIPGIEASARIVDFGWLEYISTEKASAQVLIPMADSTLLDVFDIKLLKGDPNTALSVHNSVIINESSAKKFFGDENPIGKNLEFKAGAFYTVTGVFEDISQPTHLKKYAMFNGMPRIWINDNWGFELPNTYVMLQEGVDPHSLQPALDSLVKPHVKNLSSQEGKVFRLDLQPVRDIHLYSTLSNRFSCCEENTTPAIENIRLFSGVGLLILIIACLNFINLSSARSAARGKQVGIAKVVGATRGRLFRSFMLESIVMTTGSMVIALLISGLLLPHFINISGINPDVVQLLDLRSLGLLGLFTVTVGLLAGCYPAAFLSGFRPAQVLKGTLSQGLKGSKLRAILVIFQFSISIALITGILIVHNQISYIFNKPLGYNIENIVILDLMRFQGDWSEEAFINELSSLPGVVDLTTSLMVPLLAGVNCSGPGECFIPGSNDEILNPHFMKVGTNFPQMFQMNLLSGAWLDKEINYDKNNISIIINQTMAKRLGFDDAVDKQIKSPINDGTRTYTIIGIVEDFHLKSLHSRIEPTFLVPNCKTIWKILLKLDPNDIPGTLTAVERIWLELGPPVVFNYQFLEDVFRQIHSADKRFQEIFINLTLLAIFIACLGLFALAAYAAERRTKEIGIRKALGASVSGIVMLLSKEFLILIMISNVIATPIAYYFMQRWLENFAYRISIGTGVFLFAAILSVLIALLTVSAHAVRAAMMKPVDSLRHE